MLQRSTATQSGIAIRKQVVVQLKIVLTSIPLRIFFLKSRSAIKFRSQESLQYNCKDFQIPLPSLN